MKVRWLGHSCIEIIGRKHILIDPDYRREPEPDLDFIFITHGHEDHLGRVAEIPKGAIFASSDVCQVVRAQGVPCSRLWAIKPGDEVEHVLVLQGYSTVGWLAELWARLWGRRHKSPGGTPLSFLIRDDLSLLHIGDGYKSPQGVQPDIFCLPWRRAPFWNQRFRRALIELTESLSPKYVIPIHHDIPPWEADPVELVGCVRAQVVLPAEWVEFT